MDSLHASAPATRPQRGRPPDPRKREAILEAARRQFLLHGYDASLEAVAGEAQVSRQTIYNLYGGKDELFVAVLADHTEELTAPLAEASDAVSTRETLTELARRFVAAVLSPESVQFQRALIACTQRFPKLAQSFYEVAPAKALGRLAAYLEAETRRGRLGVREPRMAAEHFLGMLKGNLHSCLLFGQEAVEPPEQAEQRIAYSVDCFLRAHAPLGGGGPSA